MSTTVPLRGPEGEKGIALIAALLVVMLVAIVGATFMMTVSGERSVSSNVQVSRAALLAADAGVRVSQQVLANQAKVKLDTLVALWPGGSTPIITSPSTMFASTSQTFTSTNPQFTATATISYTNDSLSATAQTYNFRYTITSNGTFGAQAMRQVQSTGLLRVSAQRGTFADYALFMDAAGTSGGAPLWMNSSMHFDGRVHTNGEFHFAYQPHFDDMVTSVNSKAWFWNNGSPQEVAASTYGTTDAPTYSGGFVRGATPVALPPPTPNDQQAGALGYTFSTPGTPATIQQINTALGFGPVSTNPPNGVYVVHNGALAMSGGIYVQGDLTSLTMTADTVAHTQTYRLTQGSTVTTIVVDPDPAGPTTTVNGTTTYTGVLNGGQLFVNGGIASLSGPDRVSGVAPPALGARQQLLVTATNDIVIQGDVTCENFSAANNVLGLYSSGGSVKVGSSAPSDLNLDAFVLATGPSGSFGVEGYDSGSPRGTLHLRGGIVERYYGPFSVIDGSGNPTSGYLTDLHYDRRGLIPPLYPKTPANAFHTEQPTAKTLAWKEL